MAAPAPPVDDHIRALVDAAPPLSVRQRDRLRLLLSGRDDAGQYPEPRTDSPTPRRAA